MDLGEETLMCNVLLLVTFGNRQLQEVVDLPQRGKSVKVKKVGWF